LIDHSGDLIQAQIERGLCQTVVVKFGEGASNVDLDGMVP